MAGGNVQMNVKLKGNILAFPVKISTAIFRGSSVGIDSAGYLIQMDDDAAVKFVGIAEEACTVAQAVADGTINIRVRRHGIVRMTKNTTSAVTDVGKLVYAHTEHTASVQELVGLAGACTEDNIIGLVVRREPDTPGGTAYTNDWLMVDITPAPWSAADITTHAALADQTAHTLDGIAPATYAAEAGASPQTLTAAQFEDTLVHITTAGVMALTLPATGIAAGTICRIVKTGTIGLLTMGATTLIGKQCNGNFFYGCEHIGDSVDVLCIAADSYVVLNVNQKRPILAKGAGAQTLTDAAGETVMNPMVILANTGALTVDAAAGANIGAEVMVCCDGAAATVIVTAGFGAVGAGGDTISLAQGESCFIYSDGVAWFYSALYSVG